MGYILWLILPIVLLLGSNVYFAIQMWFLRNVGEVVMPTLWE